jgi:hypothetical protein
MLNLRLLVGGLLAIGAGVVYLRNSGAYRKGLWPWSEAKRRYAKAFGVVLIVLGACMVAYTWLQTTHN